jgi:hypothetical protein
MNDKTTAEKAADSLSALFRNAQFESKDSVAVVRGVFDRHEVGKNEKPTTPNPKD